ncbi:magnesium-dependent phosphatase-1 [Ramaria rubella]|nr:magnesium-dependent phosphatase-1 [Ramaria rubella]
MTDETKRVPQLIAFDLDYTLWDFWIDTHITAPFKRNGSNDSDIFCSYGAAIEFYPHVSQIMNRIRTFKETTIAACSRTHAPALAREALSLISVPLPEGSGSKLAIEFFDQIEIYPGSKIKHFKQLHLKTGISYSEMLFYDDESRNREVESLGVTFVLVRNGLDTKTFENGLKEWRKRRASD